MNFKKLSALGSIFSLMAPLFMLRTYLGYFDNASLLSNDLANTSILNGISLFIALSIFIFSFLIFVPSIAYACLLPKKNEKMWNYETIKSATGLSLFFNAIFSSVLFFCSAYLSAEYHLAGWGSLILAVFVFISGTGLINYLCLRKPVHSVAKYKDKKTKRRISQVFFCAYPAVGMFLILLNCYGLLILLGSVNHEQISDSFVDFVRVSSAMVVLCAINILPGVIFSKLYGRTSTSRAVNGALAAAVVALILLASLMTSVIPLIINRAMTFTGIADWTVRSYVIDGSNFPEGKFSASAWHTVDSEIEDRFIVKGVMVYSLNNTRLLCPEGVKALYFNRIHFVPWSRQYDKEAAAELRKASAACQSFTSGGVNRL